MLLYSISIELGNLSLYIPLAMPANPKINVILTPNEIETLKKHAAAQSRSLSSLAAFIIREWLAQNES